MVSSVEFQGTPAATSAGARRRHRLALGPRRPRGANQVTARAEARQRRHRRRKPSLVLPVFGILLAGAGTLACSSCWTSLPSIGASPSPARSRSSALAVVAGVVFGRSVGGLVGLGSGLAPRCFSR